MVPDDLAQIRRRSSGRDSDHSVNVRFCGSGYSGTIAFRGSGVCGNAVCTAETAHCLVIGFLRSYGLDLGIGETIMSVLFEVDGFVSGMSGRILFYVGRGSPRQSQGGHLERGSG